MSEDRTTEPARWSSWDGQRYQLYVQMPLDLDKHELLFNIRIINLIRRQLLRRLKEKRDVQEQTSTA